MKPPSSTKFFFIVAIWRSSRLHATASSANAPLAAISGKVDTVDLVDAVDFVSVLPRPRCPSGHNQCSSSHYVGQAGGLPHIMRTADIRFPGVDKFAI